MNGYSQVRNVTTDCFVLHVRFIREKQISKPWSGACGLLWEQYFSSQPSFSFNNSELKCAQELVYVVSAYLDIGLEAA